MKLGDELVLATGLGMTVAVMLIVLVLASCTYDNPPDRVAQCIDLCAHAGLWAEWGIDVRTDSVSCRCTSPLAEFAEAIEAAHDLNETLVVAP